MNLGQICKLRDRSTGEDIGWFQRLRMEDGNIKFCRLNQPQTNQTSIAFDTYNDSDVDSSGRNRHSNRRFDAFCVVPTHMQVTNVRFNVGENFERTISNRVAVEHMRGHLASMNLDYARARSNLETHEEDVRREEASCQRMLRNINDLEEQIRSISSGNAVTFTYAYGRHSPTGSEFCWRVPSYLAGGIVPGDNVLVDTERGNQVITVTRIERTGEFIPHKLVISYAT